MRVQCSSCRKEIDIPDKKIPESSRFSFLCPYCREKVVVEQTTDFPAKAVSSRKKPSLEDAGDVSVELDSFPPGALVAFVYLKNPLWKAAAESFFRDAGYYCVFPASPDEARGKLRLQHHDVVLIEDEEETASIFSVINSWRGLQRRECNVILVGPGMSSLLPEEAFERDVNMCLDSAAVDRADELLTACLKGHELSVMLWHKAQEMESGYS